LKKIIDVYLGEFMDQGLFDADFINSFDKNPFMVNHLAQKTVELYISNDRNVI